MSASAHRYRPIVPDWERFLEHARRPEPTTIRVRTGRIGPAELIARLRKRGFALEEVEGLDAVFRVTEEPFSPAQTAEHWLGLFYIQQAVTAVAAPALGARPGERVLDLCAAPGGKTTHLAEAVAGGGTVVANEPDAGRIRALLGNVYRLAHLNVLVTCADGRNLPEGATFDRVLVDAPCSAEGTLRARGGELPEPDPGFRPRVSELQLDLLRKAVSVTRPGGAILYVTCTFAPEENEAVVDRVLADGSVAVEAIDLEVPHAPGLTGFEGREFDPSLERAWRLYPQHLDSGGLFLCRLRKGAAGEAASPVEGWGPVPAVFPGREHPAEAARARVEAGVGLLERDLGVPSDTPERLGWIQRGKSVWAHGLGAWPLATWGAPPERGWDVMSVGLRAFKRDPRMGERPTNELLRVLGPEISRGRLDLSEEAWRPLLERRHLPWEEVPGAGAGREEPPGGLVALALEGRVMGRGWAGRDGLRLEIPKARAKRLLEILSS